MRETLPDPSSLTPHERLTELAALLATGYARGRRGATQAATLPQGRDPAPPGRRLALSFPPESTANCLEFASPSRPDGSAR
jgi:hypothetical protein